MQIVFKNTDAFAVYRIDMQEYADTNYIIIYVGVEQLHNLLRFRERRANPMVERAFRVGHSMCLTVLSTHETREEAATAAHAAIVSLNPPANAPQTPHRKRKDGARIVRNDGTIFETVRAAAASIGADASSVSHHLNGRSGYANIFGYTFRRQSNAD